MSKYRHLRPSGQLTILAKLVQVQNRLTRIEKPMQANQGISLDHCSDSFGLGTMVCAGLPGPSMIILIKAGECTVERVEGRRVKRASFRPGQGRMVPHAGVERVRWFSTDFPPWERFKSLWHDERRMHATWFQGPAKDFMEANRQGWRKG
jgi:hypothetical protein